MTKTMGHAGKWVALCLVCILLLAGCGGAAGQSKTPELTEEVTRGTDGKTFEAEGYTFTYHLIPEGQEREQLNETMMDTVESQFSANEGYKMAFVKIDSVTKDGEDQSITEASDKLSQSKLLFVINGEEQTSGISLGNTKEELKCYLLTVPEDMDTTNAFLAILYDVETSSAS